MERTSQPGRADVVYDMRYRGPAVLYHAYCTHCRAAEGQVSAPTKEAALALMDEHLHSVHGIEDGMYA